MVAVELDLHACGAAAQAWFTHWEQWVRVGRQGSCSDGAGAER